MGCHTPVGPGGGAPNAGLFVLRRATGAFLRLDNFAAALMIAAA